MGPCEVCGKPAPLVRDPFIWDVHDEEVMRLLCDACCQARADDI